MRRASISVGANLVEGSARKGAKDQAHFYQISFSSLMELLSLLILSKDLNFIIDDIYYEMRNEIEKIGFKLNSLRNKSLTRTN